MRTRLGVLLLILVLCLAVALPAIAGPRPLPSTGKGFSIVTLEPGARDALRARGKAFSYPFPNSANRGKKFNPGGSTVGALTTAPTQEILVLFIDFSTPPPGGPAARLDLGYFDDMLFGRVYDPPEYAPYPGYPTNRTLKNYYKEVSYNQVNVVTLNMPSKLGWLHSTQSYDYYCTADGVHDNGFGPYPQNAQGMVVEAIELADPYVDFAQYAIDGIVPNLFVVHAGTGAEWSAAPNIIWSHSWDLSEGTGLTGYVADGVRLNNYAVMPEVGGDLTGFAAPASGPFPPTVGVYAHEYGHVLGLPDQYDYGYESEGTGMYSLMAGGSWNRYPNYQIFSGNSPAHLDAWSKYRLGFTTPVVVSSLTNVALRPAETSPTSYKMVVPLSGGKEYFLFENRQQIGFDQGFARRGPGVHGLAIYHVDDTVLTRNYWRPNEAENWKEFRSEGAEKAWTGETHYGISLIQADDQWHLEHGVYWTGLEGDLYPGTLGVREFSSFSKPNSSNYYFWGGSAPKFGYSGITVKNIQETPRIVSAELSFVPWVPPADR